MTDLTAHPLDLLRVLNRLTDVLQQETEMLRRMQPSKMQALQQDKIVLVAAYESLVTELREQPDELRGLDPGLHDQIVAATESFQRILTENARSLHAVKEANNRLFKAVVQAVEDRRNDGTGYSSSGAHLAATTGNLARPTSIALDQRL